MDTTFQLDGCYSLKISQDPPRDSAQSANYVWIQINKRPLPMVGSVSANIEVTLVQPSDEVVASFGIRPSEARTVASALMTAAQSVR